MKKYIPTIGIILTLYLCFALCEFDLRFSEWSLFGRYCLTICSLGLIGNPIKK